MGGGRFGGRATLGFCLVALAVPAGALAAFPGPSSDPDPRNDTPNDEGFDPCELDDEQTMGTPPECTTFFEEQFGSFGFSPDSANMVPLAPLEGHPITATQYADCAQLNAQGKQANVADGVPQCSQIAGVRADSAWKFSTGDPDTVVAILDTGIRWQDRELVEKVHLNEEELPQPAADRANPIDGGPACNTFTATDDANNDGAFNVRDFACDSGVDPADGDTESDGLLDGSDLIAAFSGDLDGDSDPDDDQNGYDDDIAGWDFFDDDNDPFDASSCCSAKGHGTGRAKEAVAQTNNGQADTGMCPDCQFMPLRIWDTFVVPTDFQAMGVVYAADNGADVTEAANGGLTNTRFSRRAYEYADSKGLALMSVSSDINSANHNYPTNYNEAIYVAGALPDTAPFETCDGISLPLVGDVVPIPGDASEACADFFGNLSSTLGITASTQPPTTSFFRNSNLTQYGGKADVVMMGATGSESTGQAAGAAALVASYGRETFGEDNPLSGNEIRQLLTMTAEDVRPLNTGLIGQPDKAQIGWDPHFGYGRMNLAGAMQRIKDGRIPPEAQLDAPDWFTPVNVDRVEGGLPIRGYVAAPHSDAGVGSWQVDYACGADAPDSTFQPIPGASGTGPADGLLGTMPKSILSSLADTCDGSVGIDYGRPTGATSDGNLAGDAYPEPDPERHSFQIRLTVREAGDNSNIGRYRKALFAYRDDGNLAGWPRPIGSDSNPNSRVTGSGGEVPPRLFDLDGDNALDVIQGTSSGELFVLDSSGEPLESFNNGQPVTTQPLEVAAAHGASGVQGGLPHENPRAPALGDLDGDLAPDIVMNAGERVYAWDRHGDMLEGFPVRVDTDLSEPCVDGVPKPCFDVEDRAITSDNHIKRGFLGATALADLDGDGTLDVVAGALDQHVYAWDGQGDLLPGFPAKLATEGVIGAEIATSPGIAELDGDPTPEIILATNEVAPGDPGLPSNPFDILNAILESSTGSNPVYAINGDGSEVPGWPVQVGVAAGDLLPLVLPGHDAAVFDQDGDGVDEVVVSAGTSLGNGGTRIVDGGGNTVTPLAELSGNSADPGPVLNLADYSSVGALQGNAPNVIKGGFSVNGAANLLAVNQNLPFAHVVQAWDAQSGAGVPAYPRATDDFQLLGQPAIANVAGSGDDRYALYGTGLYQLHAYGIDGMEAEGWPKFTGGWTQPTPAVGDADGDGDLEVSALTREGWSFLWATGTPACDVDGTSTNDEWWTSHHDEHGTNNYGHDARPPGTVGALTAERDEGAGVTTLQWTAPGDDWECGTAARYRVVIGDGPIADPGDASSTAAEGDATAQGTSQSEDFTDAELGNATHAAVFYRDDEGNWGLVRDVELPDRGGPEPGPCEVKLVGDEESNVILGTNASERITGRAGDDKLRGKGGDDCIGGGGGADSANGGAGNDKVRGGPGRDRLRGGSGDDTLRSSDKARDRVRCGPGEDTAKVNKRDRTKNCEHVTFK
ncbi:MAG: S8 family serine peptidase [Actinomycetota bacterium]|nr:S8 family serine peptidase [Actinomycetota bacterium]